MVTDRHHRMGAGKWGTSGRVLGAMLSWTDRLLVVELKCPIPICLGFFWPHKPLVLLARALSSSLLHGSSVSWEGGRLKTAVSSTAEPTASSVLLVEKNYDPSSWLLSW